MLDSDTKRRIDARRDILVGKEWKLQLEQRSVSRDCTIIEFTPDGHTWLSLWHL